MGKRCCAGRGPPAPAFVWRPQPPASWLALPRSPRAPSGPERVPRGRAGRRRAGGRGHTHPGAVQRWRRAAARGRGLPAPVPNFPRPHSKVTIVPGVFLSAGSSFRVALLFLVLGFILSSFFF